MNHFLAISGLIIGTAFGIIARDNYMYSMG
jgi:hypothetical protein